MMSLMFAIVVQLSIYEPPCAHHYDDSLFNSVATRNIALESIFRDGSRSIDDLLLWWFTTPREMLSIVSEHRPGLNLKRIEIFGDATPSRNCDATTSHVSLLVTPPRDIVVSKS